MSAADATQIDPGEGHKKALEDLREARASIDRAIQAEEAAMGGEG